MMRILVILLALFILTSVTSHAQDVENIMVRVVYVTPDWMPYSTEDAFLRAAPLKETQSLKYYDVAIWEENKSIQLYSIPNNYFDNRPINGSPEVESYRESFAIAKFDSLPDGFGSIERSSFLKNALDSFASILVKLHPNASHHLEYNGHGAPGGQLFSGFLLPQHVKEFLSFWNQELGHKLGVIDMGGPCNMGDFTTLETVCNYADYYIASDLINGNFQMDNWTIEKYEETAHDYQYPFLFRDYKTLLEVLKERINLNRKTFEYSREYMILNKVQQANYLYSCNEFVTFSSAFKAYMLKNNMDFYNSTYFGDPNYNMYGDLYGFLLNQNNDSLLILFDKIILHQANNKDFFEWKGYFNGLISPFRYGKLTLNMVPPYAELPNNIMAEENKPISIEVNAYDIEQDQLTYIWQQLSGPTITIENYNSARITLTVPKFDINNILKLEVLVDDGEYSVSDTISVLCLVANAGPDQKINEGLIVTLDGSGSFNPQGNPFTYKWTAPPGIILSSTVIAKPTFTAPEVNTNNTYVFSLVVNDGTVDSPIDQVAITVKNVNKIPIANTGSNQSINESSTVSLDGSASSDPDGDELTFKWIAPDGIALSSTTIVQPTFIAPEVSTITDYTFMLVVNDGTDDSQPDSVTITIKPVNNITEFKSICDGQNYNGWTTSGTHQRTLQSVSGCDSIVTTILTVDPKKETIENIIICQGKFYKGRASSGQFTENLVSANGCDSAVITNLSFYPTYNPVIEARGDTLTSANNYLSYQWYDETDEIQDAANNQYIISKSGQYYLVILDENGCTNTSNLVQVIYSTIHSTPFDNFKYSIIPNPNNGKFTFRIDSNPERDLTLKLINSIGQVVEVRKVKLAAVNHTEQFDISYLSKGIYHLVISSDKFQRSEKIVVQ